MIQALDIEAEFESEDTEVIPLDLSNPMVRAFLELARQENENG